MKTYSYAANCRELFRENTFVWIVHLIICTITSYFSESIKLGLGAINIDYSNSFDNQANFFRQNSRQYGGPVGLEEIYLAHNTLCLPLALLSMNNEIKMKTIVFDFVFKFIYISASICKIIPIS